jgi:TetR/AcrR family transcriptional regulator of autoinduction and epiphytic fitness
MYDLRLISSRNYQKDYFPIMVTARPPKVSFKAQMLAAREQAIIDAVNRLLAEKGFDAMTVDEVAAAVGIAKASLYKHFPSKEDLAAAAMANLMAQAQAFLGELPDTMGALDKLRATVEWTMRLKLSGKMPTLPSQNSTLRAALMAHKGYMDGLIEVSDKLGGWIEEAQAQGAINPALPAIAVLYTLYARACDPVLEFLKQAELHGDDEIIALVMSTCFEGLRTR